MRVILDKYPSHQQIEDERLGHMRIQNSNGTETRVPRPKLHAITGTLVYRPNETYQMAEFQALLDTGCEVTVIATSVVKQLGKQAGADPHPERRIEVSGRLRPAYDLTFMLPGNYRCTSPYGGFAALPSDELPGIFDLTNMLLGQDVLNQFIVTFDGPNGTVTICQP